MNVLSTKLKVIVLLSRKQILSVTKSTRSDQQQNITFRRAFKSQSSFMRSFTMFTSGQEYFTLTRKIGWPWVKYQIYVDKLVKVSELVILFHTQQTYFLASLQKYLQKGNKHTFLAGGPIIYVRVTCQANMANW